MADDSQLLRRYVDTGSETAFSELVSRYVNLVYSAALRRTAGNAELAKDVAQRVFTDLARKARSLPAGVVLAGWLHRATRYDAAQLVRNERRRRAREQQAVTMNPLTPEPAHADWVEVRPLLDAALDRLARADRDALLLRFFENRSLAEVGRALGSNEEAARKRVSRALEKLRTDLIRRGVNTTAAALASTITTHAVQVAPLGLTPALATGALAGAAAAGSGITSTLLKLMTLTKLNTGIAGAVVIAGLATPLVLVHQSRLKLEAENVALRQQVAQVADLTSANERLSNQVAQAKNSLADDQLRELLRLRSEVGSLRRQANEIGRLQEENRRLRSPLASSQENQSNGASPLGLPKDSWQFAGYATPEAAVQSLLWAMKNGDLQTFLTSFVPEAQQSVSKEFQGKSATEIAQLLSNEVNQVSVLRLDQRQVAADGSVTFTPVSQQSQQGAVRVVDNLALTFTNIGGQWKAMGN